jgi:hypothetical protein
MMDRQCTTRLILGNRLWCSSLFHRVMILVGVAYYDQPSLRDLRLMWSETDVEVHPQRMS